MNWLMVFKRIGLAAFLIAAMIAATGCASAGFGLSVDEDKQGENTDLDEQEVETPEAGETEEPDSTDEADDDQGEDEGEVVGVVESVNGNTITIDGVIYTVPDEFADELAALSAGATVKIEFFVDANGNLVITEFEVEEADVDEGEDDDQDEDDDDQDEDEDEDAEESDSGDDDGEEGDDL